MTHPDFLIIGAPKSGTTSLYHYLRQHPQVFMPDHKEPHFFAYEGQSLNFQGPGDDWLNEAAVTEADEYRALFDGAGPKDVTGEGSAMYLYEPAAPERISELRPDARLIAILRDPVERAYSSYMHLRRDGREPLDLFEDALAVEPRRIENGWAPLWHYQAMSEYADQLRRYREFEERKQLKVVLFDDLVANTDRTVREVFRFLGVDDQFQPDTDVQYNPSGIAVSQSVHAFLSRQHLIKEWMKPLVPSGLRRSVSRALKHLNLQSKPEIDPSTRRTLIDRFRADVEQVEELLQRDLSGWLTVEADSG